MDRRGFLGVCAMAAVAAACGGSDDDDAGASSASDAGIAARVAADDGADPGAEIADLQEQSVGQLMHVAFTWNPPGTLVCDGATASVDDWPELAALLGTTFGGDGTATFGLPALAAGDGMQWLIAGWGMAFADGQPAMVGEVRPMVVAPPSGSRLDSEWLPCDGRRLPIKGNEALFVLMGTTFGGDGQRDFALPVVPPLDGFAWRISRLGHFPETTCDAVTPAVPSIVPLDAYLGSIVHLAYSDDTASHTCGVAVCRGQLLKVREWPDLTLVIGDRFGGDVRRNTFVLPTVVLDGGITPAIVVRGDFPERS